MLTIKIAVLSDLHLGFQFGTERGEDAFRNAQEAISKIIAEKPQLVLLVGDIFHDKVPKPEIMSKALELFAQLKKLQPVKVINLRSRDKEEIMNVEIPAVITIYGTHERRNQGNVNPVQLLEKAGFLTHLHAESALIEVGKKRVGIHGLSGVPDQFAKQAISAWNPKPFPNAPNILLIHQTFKELIPDIRQDVMSYHDLPAGFDLFLLGHIHWHAEDKHPLSNAPILIVGSTIRTQLKKIEAQRKKGFYIINIGTKLSTKFIELENVREFYYELLDVSNKKPSEILIEIQERIIQILKFHTKRLAPLIKFKLTGSLAKGFLPTDLNFTPLLKKFSNKAFLYFDKTQVQSSQLSERAKLLYNLKQKKVSIEEIGMKLLLENLKVKNHEEARKMEELFNNLVAGKEIYF